ncbi:hypothetical protein GCM10011488_66670 [Steroidobacter agaridevorans]|nr:hypothetical protein GCM10011488_66670 [Steroidobacter agaridevorans]
MIEDEDTKFGDIESVLSGINLASGLEIIRARTATEAESLIEIGGIELMVLDISLNISAGSLGPLRGGFANLGGLNVAERMYMHGQSLRTVVVTGFEYFPATAGTRQGSFDLISLKDIEARAAELFGTDLLGCVRYSSEGWDIKLAEYAKGALEK